MPIKKEKYEEYKRIYQLKYYHKNENIRIECEYCKCFVTKAGMKKHINTEKCINIREKNIRLPRLLVKKCKTYSYNNFKNYWYVV